MATHRTPNGALALWASATHRVREWVSAVAVTVKGLASSLAARRGRMANRLTAIDADAPTGPAEAKAAIPFAGHMASLAKPGCAGSAEVGVAECEALVALTEAIGKWPPWAWGPPLLLSPRVAPWALPAADLLRWWVDDQLHHWRLQSLELGHWRLQSLQ